MTGGDGWRARRKAVQGQGVKANRRSCADWYDIKAPSFFENRNAGKTLVNRSQGLKNANDSLKGRILELSLADLNNDQEQSFRKVKLRVEDVSVRAAGNFLQ